MMADPALVEETILAHVAQAKSVNPETVARAIDTENWRKRLTDVRAAAVRLALAGRIEITRHGKPVDPENFKGVWRLRAATAPIQSSD
jgi:2-hydroxychromene-2-carboxylate isomerase